METLPVFTLEHFQTPYLIFNLKCKPYTHQLIGSNLGIKPWLSVVEIRYHNWQYSISIVSETSLLNCVSKTSVTN